MKSPRYSVILGNLGNTCDRFLPTGYKEKVPVETMLRQAAGIPGLSGVELVGSWDVTPANARDMGHLIRELGLECVSVIPDLFSQKRWGSGSLAAKDAKVRRQAEVEVRTVAETARILGCRLINLWLGQDGYDYPLQSDYRRERGWLTESLARLAAKHPDLKFALEYKPKEPRTHSFHARAADTLLMARDTGCPNVGVCIDTGHALMAGENMAESAVLLGDRLFHLHFNDNYRTWDDDMIVGSLHFVEFLELLFWLRESGYRGWYSMDQYPYREDAVSAVGESIAFLRAIERRLTPARRRDLRRLVTAGEPPVTAAWLRELILPN
jgi:xylose isomerase